MAIESKCEIKELSQVERALTVTVAGAAVKKELDRAYQSLGARVRIKGFRQGKVPRKVLEKYYAADINNQVAERVLNESFSGAVQEHNLVPVADPKIEPKTELVSGLDFVYEATVEVKPEIELSKWEGLALEKTTYKFGDEDVEKELLQLRERFVQVVPVEDREEVQDGDLVECNWSGAVDGEAVKGLGGVAYVIEIGGGNFYDEAEKALIGAKLKDKVEVTVTVKDDFRIEEVRGKEAVLTITPQQIKLKEVPELDDEFAKDVSDDYESLDDLKKAIRDGLESQAENRSRAELRDACVDALIDNNTFEIPNSLVDRQIDDEVYRKLSRMNQRAAEMLWANQRDKLRDDAREGAERTVRASLLLERISELSEIEVADSDINDYLKEEAARTGYPFESLKGLYKGDRRLELVGRITAERALDAAIEKADVTDKEAPLFAAS